VVVTAGAINRAKLQSNHHHLQTNTQFFLQADCPSCCPTNSVKALSVLIQFLGDLTGRLFATSAVYMCHVKGLCMVMEATTQADSLMLEQYVDFLQGMLFTQISQPIDYKIPASIKNHNELLRCFAVIG